MEKEQANRIEDKLEDVLSALKDNNANQTKVLDRIASHHEDTKRLHDRLDMVEEKIGEFDNYHSAEKVDIDNIKDRLKKLEDTQNKSVWLFITSVVTLAIAAITAWFSAHTK